MTAQRLADEGRKQSCLAPTSASQRRLWFLDQFSPGSSAYNIAFALHFEGHLDVFALEGAIAEVVSRHDALRTTFRAVEGQPFQTIAPHLAVPLRRLDLGHLASDERERVLRESMGHEAALPFDLAVGPLLRTLLIRLQSARHQLVLTIHHIICDQWSIDALLHEIGECYSARVERRTSQLPDLLCQYTDYARKQQAWLASKDSAVQVDHWKQQLSGAPATTTLPADRPRSPIQTSAGAVQNITFAPARVDALTQLGQHEGVTLFMVMLAAFAVLVYRYTGQEDVVLGAPIAGRTRTEFENLIGFFVNTLALRIDVSGDPTIRELLQRVRGVALDAYAHQDVPFERLVEEIRPDRDLSYNPLFQLMVVHLNTPDLQHEFSDLSVEVRPVETGTSKVDLSLYIAQSDGEIEVAAEYNSDLFDAQTIERVLQHLGRILTAMVLDPEAPISTIPLLTPGEQRALQSWNATATAERSDQPIHALFAERARRSPDAVALVQGIRRISYGELHRQSNQLARYLRQAGVGPGTIAAVCADRSIEMVSMLLAVLKTGAAYLPLDPAYPPSRLEYMLADSHAAVLLAQEHLLGRFESSFTRMLCPERDAHIVRQQSDADLTPDVSLDDPAYVIYTSGSTGRPKGVLGLHRGAVNRFQWMWDTFPFESHDICCIKTSTSFVDSVWEIFGPLLAGVPSVIIPDPAVKDPAALADALQMGGVTRIVLVPTLLRMLLDSVPDLGNRLTRLRLWVTSGEALPGDLAHRLRSVLPDARIINLYGSSEVSADVTWYEVTEPVDTGPVPIGRPIANTQVYVLDRRFQPAPIGVPGEIFVAGDGMARGYLGRADLTARTFLPNPFEDDPDSRMYRTGDLGRWRHDGVIQFMGRRDNQVKLRGMRIELGEIEAALRQHPDVEDGLALVEGDRLLAYVVIRDGARASGTGLKRHLQDLLPGYMVPAGVTILDALPETGSGKVDRKALSQTAPIRSDTLDRPFIAPETPAEIRLAIIWRDVLHVDMVGIHDDFFELGGHSLLATQLVSRIRDTFGVDLPLHTLFAHPTVAELSRLLPHDWQEGGAMAVPLATSAGHATKSGRIVRLNERGHRRPIFFLYPEIKTAFYGRALARHLGEAQPLYILHPHGFDGSSVPLTMHGMAQETVRSIRRVQPEGPYRLVARCAASTEMFEVARQLRAAGEDVELLALIDAQIPPYTSRWIPRVRALGRRLHLPEAQQRALYLTAHEHLHAATVSQVAICSRDLARALSRRQWSLAGEASSGLGRVLRSGTRVSIADLCRWWAVDGYIPGWYDGTVHLLLSEEWMATLYQGMIAGWRQLAREVVVQTVPGTHRSVVVDNIADLAGQVNQAVASLEPVDNTVRAGAW